MMSTLTIVLLAFIAIHPVFGWLRYQKLDCGERMRMKLKGVCKYLMHGQHIRASNRVKYTDGPAV